MSFYSTFGHKVPPDAGAHFNSAMKFALRAVTEGIRLELRNMKSGVKITVNTIAIAIVVLLDIKYLPTVGNFSRVCVY